MASDDDDDDDDVRGRRERGDHRSRGQYNNL